MHPSFHDFLIDDERCSDTNFAVMRGANILYSLSAVYEYCNGCHGTCARLEIHRFIIRRSMTYPANLKAYSGPRAICMSTLGVSSVER